MCRADPGKDELAFVEHSGITPSDLTAESRKRSTALSPPPDNERRQHHQLSWPRSPWGGGSFQRRECKASAFVCFFALGRCAEVFRILLLSNCVCDWLRFSHVFAKSFSERYNKTRQICHRTNTLAGVFCCSCLKIYFSLHFIFPWIMQYCPGPANEKGCKQTKQEQSRTFSSNWYHAEQAQHGRWQKTGIFLQRIISDGASVSKRVCLSLSWYCAGGCFICLIHLIAILKKGAKTPFWYYKPQ